MEILRFRAFTRPGDPRSGNPAGVVIDAESLSDADMLTIAADLGFSETAFLFDVTPDSARVRYFTPQAEIAFCGHATIASGSSSPVGAPPARSRCRRTRVSCRLRLHRIGRA